MHWIADWVWGIPLIVFTVMAHTLALFAVRYRTMPALAKYYDDEHFNLLFAVVISVAVLFVMLLLGAEAAIWAAVYVGIGAKSDLASAMLYSLSAMTTFGHADVYLKAQWQLLGALEALNGVILIGLTTAFIFSLLRGAELRAKERK